MEENEENESSKPPHRGLKKGLYVIPTAFTAANIAMGFLAVLSSVKAFQLIALYPDQAAVYFGYAGKAIALAIVFDTLDGRVARMTRTSTEIGVQLDSLADVLTFGIAPTVLMYSWAIGATLQEGTTLHTFGIFVLFMYLMCGTFRLARFNLQATRPRVLIEGTPKVDKKNFVGLPIPPAAGLLAAIVYLYPLPLSFYAADSAQLYTISIIILMVVFRTFDGQHDSLFEFQNGGNRQTEYLPDSRGRRARNANLALFAIYVVRHRFRLRRARHYLVFVRFVYSETARDN